MALVRERTIPTERPPPVGEVVPTFAGRGGVTWSAQRVPTAVLCFLDQSRYFFIQVAPQLTSRGWVDPVPNPLLLRKSGSAGNRTRDLCICSQKLWPLDHRGGLFQTLTVAKPVKQSLRLSWHSFGRAPGPSLQPDTSPSQQVSRPHFCTHFLSLPWAPHAPPILSPAAADSNNIPRHSSMCRLLPATRSATLSNWPPTHPLFFKAMTLLPAVVAKDKRLCKFETCVF